MAAKNPPCTVTDFKKTGIVAKNTQIPPRAESPRLVKKPSGVINSASARSLAKQANAASISVGVLALKETISSARLQAASLSAFEVFSADTELNIGPTRRSRLPRARQPAPPAICAGDSFHREMPHGFIATNLMSAT